MKRIRKLSGPLPGHAGASAQTGAHARWQRYRRNRIRYRRLLQHLTDLQHGLCGYCEIDLMENDRQVEHVIPLSHPAKGEASALDAANLIACCGGGAADDPEVRGDPERVSVPSRTGTSCGQAKGGCINPDFVDPRTLPALPSLTRVRADGLIQADEEACAQAGISACRVETTLKILQLNVPRLRRARADIWRALDDAWKPHRGDSRAMTGGAHRALMPANGRLPKFFTTRRSWFAPAGETVLVQAPQAWI